MFFKDLLAASVEHRVIWNLLVSHRPGDDVMLLADVLMASKRVSPDDMARATEHLAQSGGKLEDSLASLQFVEASELRHVLETMPAAPRNIGETGLAEGELLGLVLKILYGGKHDRISRLSQELKLPSRVVEELIQSATDRKLVEALGTTDPSGAGSELRIQLTELGRRRAMEAMEVSQYVGPAPVSLKEFSARVLLQRIAGETVGKDRVAQAFSDLVMTPDFIKRLGPGINSGRAMLLYGPPGNGKTTVAEKIGRIFSDIIYIPHCVAVEGQIIKIFDPSIHEAIARGTDAPRAVTLRREEFDRRWVPCKRPIVITGGELTLEMLDLKFNAHSRFYEAPLHVKALGGTFIIDDFGRQLVQPEDLLNRWIVPLQSRVDFLKLHTGKSFEIPFDELIIFSTNMEPKDLMDPAFLRRIPYKLETTGPDADGFYEIFRSVSEREGLPLPKDIFQYVLDALTVHNSYTLACYQPRFIVDQVIATCKYEGVALEYSLERVQFALDNLYTRSAAEPAAEAQPSAEPAKEPQRRAA